MKHRMCAYMVVLTFGLGLAAGCSETGGQSVDTVDVSGTVTLDDQPLEGVAVHFSRSMDHGGTGVTGADGSYKLGNGAEPGENKVYFTAVDSVDEEDEDDAAADAGMDEEGDEAETGEGGPAIPAKYSDAANPALTFTVPAGGSTEANFDLTRE